MWRSSLLVYMLETRSIYSRHLRLFYVTASLALPLTWLRGDRYPANMCVHLTHCVSGPPLQHELPPRKSRAVALQAHGRCRGRRSEPSRRAPCSPPSRRSGCEGLPLRAELQDQRQNEEAGLWHHQKPTPEQGESSDSACNWSEQRHTHQPLPGWEPLMEFLRLFWIPMYYYCFLMCWLAASGNVM